MASTNLSTYSPNEVVVTIIQNGSAHTVTGFSEDSIVAINRGAETFGMYIGADDSATRIYNANTSGAISIPLQQTSNSNDILMQLYLNDRATKNGLFEIQVKDINGRSTFYAKEAFIAVVPDAHFSNSMNLREWVIMAHKLDYYTGGNSKFDPSDLAVMDSLNGDIDPRWLP